MTKSLVSVPVSPRKSINFDGYNYLHASMYNGIFVERCLSMISNMAMFNLVLFMEDYREQEVVSKQSVDYHLSSAIHSVSAIPIVFIIIKRQLILS